MSFECPECESHVVNNICSVCEYQTFIIPIDVIQRKNDPDYLALVEYLVKKTNINEEVIHNLIAFDHLFIISDIKIRTDHSINQMSISVPEHINNTKYKEHPFLIFANFSLYNTNFSVKHFDLEQGEIIPIFNNNLSRKKQFIELRTQPFKKPKIGISLQYILKDTIPYSTSLLNQEEEEELKSDIEEQISEYDIVSWSEHDEENNSFFEKTVEVDWTQEQNIILQNIQSAIDKFQDEVDSIIEELKERNKSIFERALLEQQMKTF